MTFISNAHFKARAGRMELSQLLSKAIQRISGGDRTRIIGPHFANKRHHLSAVWMTDERDEHCKLAVADTNGPIHPRQVNTSA
jgi:hypothetical protein